MTKTVDEYIAHKAHEQAENKYYQARNNMNREISSLLLGMQPSAFGPKLGISFGNEDEIIDELAESIEIKMKNKLVEMLVENDD